MPRSPADATRFTATGPYISTKPSSNASSNSTSFSSNPNTTPPYGAAASPAATQLQFGASAPSGESPQRKIARLRAAAALAKRGKETQFDRAVRIGRIWADRAHRVTAFSLVGLTVISGVVATAGITDMLLHNRRRRNEWLAEKKAQTARDLVIAKQAVVVGAATEDQMLLINQERAAEEAAFAKKNRPGIFKKTTSWLYGGLSEEEKKGGRLGAITTASSPDSNLLGQEGEVVPLAAAESMDKSRRQHAEVEETFRTAGGPLDKRALLAVEAASDTAKSWTSWLTGR